MDNDGDVDFLVVNAAAHVELFKNEAEKKGNWLMVRAIEPALGGRDAYNAVITIKTASPHRGHGWCAPRPATVRHTTRACISDWAKWTAWNKLMSSGPTVIASGFPAVKSISS